MSNNSVLTETQKKQLPFFKKGITYKEIAQKTGMGEDSVYALASQLRKKGQTLNIKMKQQARNHSVNLQKKKYKKRKASKPIIDPLGSVREAIKEPVYTTAVFKGVNFHLSPGSNVYVVGETIKIM